MNTSLLRPKLATLDELLAHEFYKRLVASAETILPQLRKVRDPKEVIESKFSKEIVDIYKTLFSGSFNKLDMSSLEHSDYLSHLLPCLSLESFPLIANLDNKSQEVFKNVKLCSIMTCVWCFVENHSSGRSEYVDVLSNVSTNYKDSFECLFFNAAQLLMLESWNEDLCDHRDFDSFERLTVLEQRALLRFFIVCFQRIELAEVRRCCMSLLSPQVWMHIPEELREANFFKNNKVSKLLFMKSFENYKLKHKACNFGLLLGDSNTNNTALNNTDNNGNTKNGYMSSRKGLMDQEYDSVKRLYELEPNSNNLEYLNLSYRLVLTRDFMNSVVNQFIYILEDYLSYFNNSNENNTRKDDKENSNTRNEDKDRDNASNSDNTDSDNQDDYELMRLMYVENYLELFVDLLSQLHLRRIIKPLIEYKLILVRCKNHLLYESMDNNYGRNKTKYDTNIFVELVNILEYYLNFNINEELGVSEEYNVMLEEYYKRFNKFQRVCYLNYKDDENLKNIHLVNNYSLNTNLVNILSNLNLNVLIQLNQKLFLIPSGSSNTNNTAVNNTNNNSNEEDKQYYLKPRSIELLPKKKKSKKLVKKLLISNLTNYLKKPVNELVFINKNNFYLNPFSSLFNSSSTLNPELLERKDNNMDGNTRNEDSTNNSNTRERREDEFVEFEEDMGYIKLGTLSLFKLNLQYLTLFDYLYRNFILYQFEVIFQIKQYIQQQIYLLFSFSSNSFSSLYNRANSNIGSSVDGKRDEDKNRHNMSSKPVNEDRDNKGDSSNGSGNTVYRSTELSTTTTFSRSTVGYEAKQMSDNPNWVGRMFISIKESSMRVGNKRVEMMVTVDLSLMQDYKIRQEWQQLTKYDILYLIQLLPHYSRFSTGNKDDDELLWGKDVRRIRFGEILEVLDEEDNNVLEFNPLDKKSFAGFRMRIKLLVDYEQYMKDIQEDLEYYSSFNLVMRRSKRQNNFKSILTNIQSVLNHKVVIPNWLQVLLLGYIHSLKTENKNNTIKDDKENSNNSEDKDEELRYKRRKKEEDRRNNKIGINYLNTFKSKEQLLNTTRFVSVKLIPCLDSSDGGGDTVYSRDSKSSNGSDSKSNGDVHEKENRMYVDIVDGEFNEYVYNKTNGSNNKSTDKMDKNEFVSRLKVMLLNNDNVRLFVENHLNNIYNNGNKRDEGRDNKGDISSVDGKRDNMSSKPVNEDRDNKGDSSNDTQEPLEYLELYGVKFEVYVEKSYLKELNKVNNNYYVGNNRVPRFFITNFNEPYQLKNFGKVTSGSSEVPEKLMGSANASSNFKFVGRQVESIVNGSLEGLTVIMGPPGTGKTDVVSQIIAILFNNFENEKIVICTHSNFALNDIFTKLVRNEMIDEHYMVRLGHSDLEVDQMGHFSKFGRVNYILQRRLDLLEVIKSLKEQLNVLGDYEFTIQYSLTFLQYYLLNNKELFGENGSNYNNSTNNSNGSKSNSKRDEDRDNKGDSSNSEDKNMDGVEHEEESRVELMERGLDNFFRLGLEFPYTLKDVKKLYNKIHQMVVSVNDRDSKSNGVSSGDNLNNTLVDANHGDLELKNMKKRFVEKLYECLNELLPFEVLRNNKDRMKYLVENYCRIVAMTCTHASIAREELSTLNYKSLIFEEAAQVLEIESFIPICSDIKRLVLVGDHLQLSPIIQNSSLQKYSNLNQSLFLRLIRLKYPYIQLNVQARSRQEILNVYKDFYPHEIYTLDSGDGGYEEYKENKCNSKDKDEELRYKKRKKDEEIKEEESNRSYVDKTKLLNTEEFRDRLVKGFKVDLRYTVQFLDVRGEESSPIKYFYQNLDEAHYCVYLYMVMRLMGLEDIVILTAYNGQKCLIEDIVKKKCSWNNRIGSPIVSTIDKFQGRQANYVIVSLVRTKNVGYLRDPRRFVVATSRSKLGLYIVGSKKLIQNVKELSVFNKQLNRYPNKLYFKLNQNVSNDDKDKDRDNSNTREGKDYTKPLDENELFEVRDNKELELLVQMLM